MSKKLANRRVVITGAGSGLGQTSAQLFARQGAELILVDINAKGMEETSVLVEKEGSRSTSYVCDVAIESEIQRLGEQLCKAYPKIDVLYNNAGIAYGEINQMVNTINQEKWLRYLAINTIAPLLIAEVLRSSLASAKGLIINQSSIASYAPATVYGVTKAALNSLTYGMA
ncbi:SDR family NAD(P)-dependent oxidoreductase, partial [Zhongshania sp.]|uniref:SDR family NAD(P)-dependent oxidoreductase n=1 Tax=Zhongshania sp. TaxID=1971902 RepID=UPI003568C026